MFNVFGKLRFQICNLYKLVIYGFVKKINERNLIKMFQRLRKFQSQTLNFKCKQGFSWQRIPISYDLSIVMQYVIICLVCH